MFAKLLKQEFRTSGKALGFMTLAMLIAGGIGAVLVSILNHSVEFEDQIALVILSAIMLMGIILGIVALTSGSAFYLYYRFYKNKFTDQGYLTFTLPASTHQILLSSILNIFIWEMILSLAAIVSLLTTMLPVFIEVFSEISSAPPNDADIVFSEMNGWLVLLTMISSLAYGLILPTLSITIGSLIAKKYKLLVAFAVGYGISMAISMLSGLLTVVELISLSNHTIPLYYSGFTATQLTVSCVILVLSVGGYFLMHHLVDKKLNI